MAHALHKWWEATKTLTYEYNGQNIIEITFPLDKEPGYRHGSDGTMQSIQYIQQIYLEVEEPVDVTISFLLGEHAMNLKPSRASEEEAIIGQLGNILIHGANGLYDKDQDLMISFHGVEWEWETSEFIIQGNRKIARVKAHLTEKPMFINLKMHYYNKHLGYQYYKPWEQTLNDKAISGWCSWEAFRRDIDIEKIEQITIFMEQKLKDYGLEYIQVDDGYQKMPLPYNPKGDMKEGWLTCEESKFPGGHSQIIQTISSRGFVPAIWTNANITNEEFPKYHSENVIFHEGKPLKGEWIDFLYQCDTDTLEKQVEPIFEGFREEGYQYVKIDAIRHLLLDGLHEAVRLGIMTNEEASKKFRDYLQSTRDGLGDDIYYLASWGEMHEVIGIADACRISMDANPTWAGIHMQLFEMARWFHTQRILFLNDPDHVCVRTKLEWAKSVLSLISLSGGLYMLSDTVDAYTEEKLQVIQKTLPPLKTATAETGMLNVDFPAYTWTKLHGFAVQSHETPVEMEDVPLEEVYNMAGNYPTMNNDHPFSSLWSFHLHENQMKWCVLGRFATVPLKKSQIELKKVHLNEEKEYLAFDFWEERFLGVVKNKIQVSALNVGECQIVALREKTGIPQFIASTRHVSMDAVSVKKAEFDREDNSMELDMSCVENSMENYYIYVPGQYAVKNYVVDGANIIIKKENELLIITVYAYQENVKLRIEFEDSDHK